MGKAAVERYRPKNYAHEAFAKEYVRNGYCGSRAYKTVYKTINDATAERSSHRLLRNVRVLALIEQEEQKLLKSRELSRRRIQAELQAVAFLDPAELVDEYGNLLPLKEMEPIVRRAIAGIKATKDGVELKIANKLKALELLGRDMGMFTERVQHEGGVALLVTTGVAKLPGEAPSAEIAEPEDK